MDLTNAVIAQINSLSALSPFPDNLFSDDGATTQSPANAIYRTAPPLPGVPPKSVRVRTVPNLIPAPAAMKPVPVPEPSPTLSPTPQPLQPSSTQTMLSSSPPLAQSLVFPAPSTDRGDQRYSLRPQRTTWRDRVFNLTARKAIELYGDKAYEPIYASGNHPNSSERSLDLDRAPALIFGSTQKNHSLQSLPQGKALPRWIF